MTVPTPIPTGSEHARWCGVPGCAAALLLEPAKGENDLSDTVALVGLYPDDPSQLVLVVDQDSRLLDEVISNASIRAQGPLLPLAWVDQGWNHFLSHRALSISGPTYRAAYIFPLVDPDNPYRWRAAYSSRLHNTRYRGHSPSIQSAQHSVAHQLLNPLSPLPIDSDPTPIDYNLLHRAALAPRLLPE